MGCVHLLSTSQLLKLQNHTRHCHPRILFRIDFHMVLAFFHSNFRKPSFARIGRHNWK